jgi:hypothetical protein
VAGQFPTERVHLVAKGEDPPSRVEVELRGQLYAGAGLAFALPLGDYRLRIAPSADYLRGWMRLEAAGPLAGRRSDSFDAAGARLAIEVEAGRRGPLAIGVFLRSQVYWIVGERGIGFFRLGKRMVQGGAGLRLSWVGDSR